MLDQAIELAMQLPIEQREILVDVIRKRDIEMRRAEIAADAQTSIAAFHVGQFNNQSASEVIEDLRRSLDEE
ncbi:MAG: hypothetical protein J5I90_08850 [Caldilineales bacterium]|nr:hypothetical protein [Caldilineales bacterium]